MNCILLLLVVQCRDSFVNECKKESVRREEIMFIGLNVSHVKHPLKAAQSNRTNCSKMNLNNDDDEKSCSSPSSSPLD